MPLCRLFITLQDTLFPPLVILTRHPFELSITNNLFLHLEERVCMPYSQKTQSLPSPTQANLKTPAAFENQSFSSR